MNPQVITVSAPSSVQVTRGALAREVVHRDVVHLGVDGHAAPQQRVDLIPDDLLLTVDRDLATGETQHVDVVTLVIPAQVTPV
jgi:hypothetical protein